MSNSPTFKISFSQLLAWDRCRMMWKLGSVDKWVPTQRKTHMELGSLGHAMLFDWYKTGVDHSQDMANTLLADWEALDAESVTAISTALSLFRVYVDNWSPENDKQFATESLEEHFEVELVTPKGRNFTLEGYIDRSSRDRNGNLWIEDYKFTGRFWTPIQLTVDPQLPFYAAALRTLGRPVHGTMYTQVNTYPYKKRHERKAEDLIHRDKIYRSPRELDAFMYEICLQVDELIENRDNIRRSLRKDCKDCSFQEPCYLGLKGIDMDDYLASSGAFRKRSPRLPDDAPERHSILSTRLLETHNDIEIVDEPL